MNYDFEYQEKNPLVQLPLDSVTRERFRSAPKVYSYSTPHPPADWQDQFYRMFLEHPDDAIPVKNLVHQLRQHQPSANDDELAEMAIAFVQGSITYDWQSYYDIQNSQVRYPYETLFDKTGVCADKTILLARILREIGFDIALFTFERANHMALGLRVPSGNGSFSSDYVFVESTNYTPIGRIPSSYAGGMKLDRRPKIIPIPGGGKTFQKMPQLAAEQKEMEKQYGKEYLFLNKELRGLKVQMVEMEAEMKVLKRDLAGCRGTLPPEKYERCQAANRKYNDRVNDYNALVQRYNTLAQQQSGTPG